MKKHKILVSVTMSLLILGLVAAYIPLIFAPQPQIPNQSVKPNQETASLLPVSPSSSDSAQDAVTKKNVDGFADLEKENNLLEDLDKLLNDTSTAF